LDQTVAVWDAASGTRLYELTGHQGEVNSVAWSPDGRHLASGSGDKTMAVWDAASGTRLHGLTGHQDGVNSVAWSPDGRRLASGSNDQTVVVWDAASGKRLATIALDDSIRSLAWHRDSCSLVACGGNVYRLEFRER
jgi:WD40 repeat protein